VQFGRDLEGGAKALWSDPAALELVPLTVLKRQTAAAGLAAHQAEPADRAARLLAYAFLASEVARRTGEPDCLVKAATAAERAARVATQPAVMAAARIAQATGAMASGVLFADPTAADAAQDWIATPEVAATAAVADQAMALRARIEAFRALGSADLDRAVRAGGVFDAAVDRLDAAVREDARHKVAAVALRCDRAEFLVAFGVRLKDRALIVQAEADLRQLVARIDPDRLPLSWARAEGLRGVALAALGDLDGDAKPLADSVKALAGAVESADFAYSPLDRARISHAMALSLQSLAEVCGDDIMYDHALSAFDQAIVGLEAAPGLPLRAMVIHDRAACVARRAERTGDPAALDRAEASFRAQLASGAAAADPIAWAVTQLALARVYDIRAELEGDLAPPSETAFALTEAQDVFQEHGLRALAEVAADALARIRAGSKAG
jgi:hypothetical protein